MSRQTDHPATGWAIRLFKAACGRNRRSLPHRRGYEFAVLLRLTFSLKLRRERARMLIEVLLGALRCRPRAWRDCRLPWAVRSTGRRRHHRNSPLEGGISALYHAKHSGAGRHRSPAKWKMTQRVTASRQALRPLRLRPLSRFRAVSSPSSTGNRQTRASEAVPAGPTPISAISLPSSFLLPRIVASSGAFPIAAAQGRGAARTWPDELSCPSISRPSSWWTEHRLADPVDARRRPGLDPAPGWRSRSPSGLMSGPASADKNT